MNMPPLQYSATWKYTCGHEMTMGYGNKAAMLADKSAQESGKCWHCKNSDLMAKMKAKKEGVA